MMGCSRLNYPVHRHVQALVDDSWRGGADLSEWSLPDDTPYLLIVLHFFWPTIEMVHNSTGNIAVKTGWRGLSKIHHVQR